MTSIGEEIYLCVSELDYERVLHKPVSFILRFQPLIGMSQHFLNYTIALVKYTEKESFHKVKFGGYTLKF